MLNSDVLILLELGDYRAVARNTIQTICKEFPRRSAVLIFPKGFWNVLVRISSSVTFKMLLYTCFAGLPFNDTRVVENGVVVIAFSDGVKASTNVLEEVSTMPVKYIGRLERDIQAVGGSEHDTVCSQDILVCYFQNALIYLFCGSAVQGTDDGAGRLQSGCTEYHTDHLHGIPEAFGSVFCKLPVPL